ncbi:transcription factor TFIIIB component B'' [Vigna unguiculata]|uniref:Transcription factor TFIIIB component B n=1 Tax=Vigna unguiculata TaxID=3917 RepID=A0A4D6LT99_VIGUN|nr:transcription factor TFIIIB component B'' [Vigna unguiculata]
MDPFDDLLPEAPVARIRPGAKFVPKAKAKQRPRKEVPSSEHATSSKDELTGNECENAVASTLSAPAEDFPNSESGNLEQISVEGDSAALVGGSTITASEIGAGQNSTNLLESACEADPTDFDGDSVTNFVSETNLSNGTTQPVHPANVVENKLNNLASPFSTCSTIDRMKEPPKNWEGSFLDINKYVELIDNSLQSGTDLGFKSVSDNKVSIIQTVDSKSNFEKEPELVSAEIGLVPFSDILADLPTRNVHKFKPKIKPRPRVGNMPASASSDVVMEKSVELPTSCTENFQSFQSSGVPNQSTSLPLPTSEILRTNYLPDKFGDSNSLAAAIPSQLDSLNAMLLGDAVHNGTRDWPSTFGKSSGEAADIFSGLESLDDFLTQATTDTGKPALHSFNEKGAEENFVTPACSSINSFGECDTTQVQRCPEYHTPEDPVTFHEATVLNESDTHTNNRMSETEEIVDLNPTYPRDDVFDYQSMKSGEDPTSGILVHEDLTIAADSSTLADFLHANDSREKEKKKDGSDSCSLRKNKRSSISGEEDNGGKTSRQRRKLAACKPKNSSLNEEVEDDNDLDPPYHSNEHELQENDDDYEVDHSSKKRGSKRSQKKSVAKSGKMSQRRKKADDDVQKKTKEPPKKFSHSTRRKKRCVDKALLEIPEDELDPRTLPMKDIILLAEYRERQAKKDAMTSNTSPSNQSGGDSLHGAGAYNEQEFSGSEDDRDPYDDQDNERITSTPALCNYQTFMEKTPKGKWSKQDTELFYEAIRELGTDFSMIQQLFPDKTRRQIKLKYKKEEREHYLRLRDAIHNRAKDHFHYNLLIERLQQASTKAEEEVVDLATGTNEEAVDAATVKHDAEVKEQEDSAPVQSPEEYDDSEDDSLKWSQYKSLY